MDILSKILRTFPYLYNPIGHFNTDISRDEREIYIYKIFSIPFKENNF